MEKYQPGPDGSSAKSGRTKRWTLSLNKSKFVNDKVSLDSLPSVGKDILNIFTIYCPVVVSVFTGPPAGDESTVATIDVLTGVAPRWECPSHVISIKPEVVGEHIVESIVDDVQSGVNPLIASDSDVIKRFNCSVWGDANVGHPVGPQAVSHGHPAEEEAHDLVADANTESRGRVVVIPFIEEPRVERCDRLVATGTDIIVIDFRDEKIDSGDF